MKNSKKVSIIMYGLGTGGAELQFLELAKELNKTYQLVVYGLAKRGELAKEFENANIKLEVFEYNSLITFIISMFKAQYSIKKYRPSTIISTSFIGNATAYISKKLYFTKKIISFQTVAKCMTKYKKLDSFILNNFDYLVAGANQISNYLLEHEVYNSNIHVIHNWVDFSTKIITESKEETYTKFNISNDYYNLICIARLHEQKGHKYLIQAMSLLPKEFKIRLYLVGKGPEEEYLKKLILKNKLSNIVFLLGEQRDENYVNLLGNLDTFILPSLYEGLPRTLLDAMYLGKTIIATNVDGNIEAIAHNETALLVNSKNYKELKDTIVMLYQNKTLQTKLGVNAKKHVVKYFDMKKQFKKILELI